MKLNPKKIYEMISNAILHDIIHNFIVDKD